MMPCPKCTKTNWMQYCRSVVFYPVVAIDSLEADHECDWTFGDPEVTEDVETLYYSCGSCGYDADEHEQALIGDAIS